MVDRNFFKLDDIDLDRLIPKQSEIPLEESDRESVDGFQRYIYELFEKNGIMHDLRAYLRKHIISILKSAHSGDTLTCHKLFTERLELKNQAINILIAEYLMCSELNYTLSVFVSEIPLPNMVFDFAKTMMKVNKENKLHFNEKDIWSIIKHLGIKCDSKGLKSVMDMYSNSEKRLPLLVCILNNVSMFEETHPFMESNPLLDTASSSGSEGIKYNTRRRTTAPMTCNHKNTCKSCRTRYETLKEKSNKRIQRKETMIASLSQNRQSLMKNVSLVERKLINEMFDQVSNVYETESAMQRAHHERDLQEDRLRHSRTLDSKKKELEESFKARQEELDREVRAKKKFLWGLARSLRDQYEKVTRAMAAVKSHTQLLRTKEETLKSRVKEVSEMLRSRGEDIQASISKELVSLQAQLALVRKEQEAVNMEKKHLENLKTQIGSSHDNVDMNDMAAVEDLNYNRLQHELTELKKHIESKSKADLKRSQEHCTSNIEQEPPRTQDILNNEQEIKVREEDNRLKNNQVVNDFKKQKNVNFNLSIADDVQNERERQRSDPRSADNIAQLKEENERLKENARVQEQQLVALSAAAALLHAELHTAHPPPLALTLPTPRPRSAPLHSMGAGEEVSPLTMIPPRVFEPGDTVPFIGLLKGRHGEPQRHLLPQWRGQTPVRPRRSHLPPRAHTARLRLHTDLADTIAPNNDTSTSNNEADNANNPSEPSRVGGTDGRGRQGTPTPDKRASPGQSGMQPVNACSLLQEAKEKLRMSPNSPCGKASSVCSRARPASPVSVLREAKQRLRKLEIEAEAAERCYRLYRNRRSDRRPEKELHVPTNEELGITKNAQDFSAIHTSFNKTLDQLKPASPDQNRTVNIQPDTETFLREYRNLCDLGKNQFANRNTTAKKVKPIPDALSTRLNDKKKDYCDTLNYLETPLTEFRKLYGADYFAVHPVEVSPILAPQQPTSSTNTSNVEHQQPNNELANSCNYLNTEQHLEVENTALIEAKNCKEREMEILKDNINTIDNVRADEIVKDINEEGKSNDAKMLRIEVDTVSEVKQIEAEPLVVIVQSTVDSTEDTDVKPDCDIKSGNMTIFINPKPKEADEAMEDINRRSLSPKKATRLTKNDVLEAIYHAEKQGNESMLEIADNAVDDKEDEYPDDFIPDVENYENSDQQSRIDTSSISLPSPDPIWPDSI